MSKIFLLSLFTFVGLISFSRPFIGVVTYYLLALLGPQYIWWWQFGDLRPSLIVAVGTIVGVSLHILKNNYDSGFLFNKQNGWLAFLWFCIACSYFLGPYVSDSSSFSSFGFAIQGPKQLFSLYNIIFIFYFFSALELNQVGKLRYLFIVFVVSVLILTYWANMQYFNQNWSNFNYGRLRGPASPMGGDIYRDENTFAMLFVTGLPFIYYLGWEVKKTYLRWFFWLCIPLSWHAIFLTGSRGGLLGIAVTSIVIFLQSNRKFLALPLVLLFLFFYQWQAGDVMQHRSESIVNIEGEDSANDRINAWKGGVKIILNHPVVGVGLGTFVTALPDYIESRNMVAHNTLVQLTAESGLGAGLAYLVVVCLFFLNSIKIRRYSCSVPNDDEMKQIEIYNNAITASFSGLIVCSLFLSLNTYETFFVLLLFNNALYQIYLRRVESELIPALSP